MRSGAKLCFAVGRRRSRARFWSAKNANEEFDQLFGPFRAGAFLFKTQGGVASLLALGLKLRRFAASEAPSEMWSSTHPEGE